MLIILLYKLFVPQYDPKFLSTFFWVLVQNTGIPKNQQFQDGKKSDNHSKIKVGEILFRNQWVEKMSVALIYKQG